MIAALFLGCLLSSPLRALPAWQTDPSSALQTAKRKGSLVLLDFSAPWCYSCYYMEQHVLREPEMDSLSSELEFVSLDVDSSEGKRLQEKYFARMLPTYVVLNADGAELGRIAGEQTKDLFFSQLRAILAQNAPLDRLESAARGAGPDSTAAAARALGSYVQRRQPEEGLKLFGQLSSRTQAQVQSDPQEKLDVLRLKLLAAGKTKDAQTCSRLGRLLLAGRGDCDVMYDFSDQQECLSALSPKRLASVYSLEKGSIDQMLQRRIFGDVSQRCADFRTGVETGVALYKGLGEKRKASGLLARAINMMQAELKGNVALDRNKADNLRVFYEMAGKKSELETLYPKLLSAYPNDYVYPYRYGKFLLERGEARSAMKPLDRAQRLASGAGKLLVADARARVFAKLGRTDQARREIETGLGGDAASFPQEADRLRKTKAELKL